jgi:hypothetical protein
MRPGSFSGIGLRNVLAVITNWRPVSLHFKEAEAICVMLFKVTKDYN